MVGVNVCVLVGGHVLGSAEGRRPGAIIRGEKAACSIWAKYIFGCELEKRASENRNK